MPDPGLGTPPRAARAGPLTRAAAAASRVTPGNPASSMVNGGSNRSTRTAAHSLTARFERLAMQESTKDIGNKRVLCDFVRGTKAFACRARWRPCSKVITRPNKELTSLGGPLLLSRQHHSFDGGRLAAVVSGVRGGAPEKIEPFALQSCAKKAFRYSEARAQSLHMLLCGAYSNPHSLIFHARRCHALRQRSSIHAISTCQARS